MQTSHTTASAAATTSLARRIVAASWKPGLFAVLTIIVKYLSLLLNLTFRQQKYLVESIEKLQK